MKRFFVFLTAAASMLMLAACEEQISIEPASKGLSLNATVEQHVDGTKTSLDGSSVLWIANDEIAVFDNAATPLKAELKTTDDGVTSASFNDVTVPGEFAEPTCAIYPYAAATSATSAGVITFAVDATQNYVLNSFDPEHNVMVGAVDAGNIAFKNVFGLLKLQLKGVMTVSSIKLTGKNNEKLNGTFEVNAASGDPAANTTTAENASEKTITLDCSAYGGVPISRMTATDFYFVVPVGALSSGFDAVIQDAYGVDWKVTISTNSSNTIARKTIRKMPERKVSLLTSALAATYTEVEYIASDSGAYIETGYAPTVADHFDGWEVGWKYTKVLPSGIFSYVFGNYPGTDGYSGTYRNVYPYSLTNGGSVAVCSRNTSYYTAAPAVDTWIRESCWRDYGYQRNGVWYDKSKQVCNPGDESFEMMIDDNDNTIRIFRPGSGSNPTLRDMGCQIEYLKFLNSTSEARYYFLACKKGDAVGMYDLKNDTWYAETQLAGFESSHLTAGSNWTPDVRR
jgi:hypothetical protein